MRRGLRTVIAWAIGLAATALLLAGGSPARAHDAFACSGPGGGATDSIWCAPSAPGGVP